MVRPNNLKDKTFAGLRGRLAGLVEAPAFIAFITAVIVMNAVTLGMETDPQIMRDYGSVLLTLDKVALAIFVVEIALKLAVYRLSFFRDGWNVFDFIIVGIALLPASGPLAVLRALRVLRVLRLMSVVPSMRRVISALLNAIPGMASIIGVLLIMFYVSAVLATKLFAGVGDPLLAEKFHSIGASMYTLFQIMTLEGWSNEVVRPMMDHYPYSWLFFIPFIIITSFAVLNLFIGIIVDAMNMVHGEAELDGKNPVEHELKQVKAELAEIKALLKIQNHR